MVEDINKCSAIVEENTRKEKPINTVASTGETRLPLMMT